jgi:hypothetical protein
MPDPTWFGKGFSLPRLDAHEKTRFAYGKTCFSVLALQKRAGFIFRLPLGEPVNKWSVGGSPTSRRIKRGLFNHATIWRRAVAVPF